MDDITTAGEVEAVRRHITYKMTARELDATTGERMLSLLDAGARPDYAELYRGATQLPIPGRVFHTARVGDRDAISRTGLRPAAPGQGGYAAGAVGQPSGVYVAAAPDLRGVWAHEDSWDVWEVETTGLAYAHDELNPGCWILTAVPASALRLHTADAHY